MLDIELGANFLHHLIIQVKGVVKNDPSRKTISIYDLFLMNLHMTDLVTLAYETVSTHFVK